MAEKHGERRLPDPLEGKDYLVDYYAVLGVEHAASEEVIKKAYTDSISVWHPDLIARAAPELQKQATEKTRILTTARDILLNPESREVFTQKISTWEGPISKDGTPILSFSALTRFQLKDESEVMKAIQRADILSGHNEEMFSFIEETYLSSENPSSRLEAAYREALAKKDAFVALREGILNESLGVSQTDEYNPPVAYLKDARFRLSSRLIEQTAEIEDSFAMLQAGNIPVLGSGSESVSEVLHDDPNTALVIYREEMLAHFEETASKIRSLAAEREDIIKKRLGLVRGTYIYDQKELFDRVIIGTQSQVGYNWLPFRIVDGSFEIDIENTEDLSDIEQEDQAKQLIAKGFNIITLQLEERLPVLEQLGEVALKHAENYFNQQGVVFERGSINVVEKDE